ncbi:MAG: hypothetical protein JKY01_09875 [Pseudomonadales bacterium]|nr:hypothetical protein [Pseudomonadales bacterium]
MRFFLPKAFFILAVFACFNVQASSLDVNLRNEAIRLALRGPINQSGLNLSISGLHHEDDRDLITVGVSVIEEFANESFVGIGGHLYGFDAKNTDGMGVALGGFFRYALPAFPGLGLGGQLYYGPDVVSFNDVKQYFETAFRLEYQLLSQANVYVGYRYIKIKMDSGRKGRIDDGVHLGLRLDY